MNYCKLLIIPFLLIYIPSTFAGEFPDCGQNMGYDTYACPCGILNPCDPLLMPNTNTDYVSKYTTSKEGTRLRATLIYLTDNKYNITVPPGDPILHVRITDTRRQEILGFGAAFTDSAAYNIMKIGNVLGDRIINDFFGYYGLEYNIGRIPIGGSDFSLRAYSLDDGQEDLNLNRFNLTAEDLQYKIPVIKRAMERVANNSLSNVTRSRDIKFFGSPWSAPAWMKTNNDLTNGGSIKGEVGSEYWQSWARYFVRYLNAYKAQGIDHWGLTVQNEPYSVQSYNSMFYTPEMMRDFVADTLGPELERSGYGADNLTLMVYDHNLDAIEEWTSTIYASDAASTYVAGTAFHWYSNTPKTVLDQIHQEFPDKFLFSSEASEGPGVKLGAWRTAERYAYNIIQDLLHWSVGWTDWNLVVDIKGGPSWADNYVDAPIIIDPDNQRYIRQPQFYVMAHFSKYIKPGSVRVDTDIIQSLGNKAIIAAFRGNDNDTTIVIVNNDDAGFVFVLDDKVKSFGSRILPRSITTFVYYD